MLFKGKSGKITREKVLAALSHVDDPDLKKDLVTLNMIQDLVIEGKSIQFSVVLTTPACPMKEAIHNACLNAIKLMVDAEAEVQIKMTAQVQAAPNQSLPNVKNVIAISSGKGGVGKSTVAANLAVALAETGASVGLIDADIYGPSQPLMFGFAGERPMLEQKENGKDMLIPFERHGVKLMSLGVLVREDQAIVWRGPMASKALKQLIFDTDWGEIDYLLVDLPPGTGDIHLTLVQALPVTGAVVITTPQKVAVADARKGAEMFRTPQIKVPLLGVVENMAHFVPDDAPDKQYAIFGEGGGQALADALQIPLLSQLPIREGMADQGDRGTPAAAMQDHILYGAFMELAQTLAQSIAIRNAAAPPTNPVQMTG